MKKILFFLALILMIGIVGLRAYQSYTDGNLIFSDAQKSVTEETTQTAIPETTPAASVVTASPEPTPYDPEEVLDLEDIDEETAQEIIQTETEWAPEGGGVGQITPATESDSTPTQPTDQATIDIGEGQSGMIGF